MRSVVYEYGLMYGNYGILLARDEQKTRGKRHECVSRVHLHQFDTFMKSEVIII